MGLWEIPYRLNQALHITFDRFLSQHQKLRFSIPAAASDANIELAHQNDHFQKVLPYLDKSAVLSAGNAYLNQHHEVFGQPVVFEGEINFHLDPKTGGTWPLKFWNDINYRFEQRLGGVKLAWEINRLQHWPQLAVAYGVTQDERYLNKIFQELKLWLRTNPYPLGINWISSVEMGIRIVNLHFALCIMGTKVIPADAVKDVYRFAGLHARHLYRYPSAHSSRANHSLTEALGLLVAGFAFPGLRHAAKWRDFGVRLMEREVCRQLYDDGSGGEHSLHYLQLVADHYLVYYWLCQAYHMPIGRDIKARLKAVVKFLSGIIDCAGEVPNIGDDDDGYLARLWFGQHNNYLSLLNTGTIMFDRSELRHPAATLDSKTLLLLGESAHTRWHRDGAAGKWRVHATYYAEAGLAVIADERQGQKIFFVGNSGPLGLKPLAGHGHADALSIWLSVDGEAFLIDPGTWVYHGGGPWRHFFRSTSAHNTIEIDGKDQADQLSDFMFADFYKIQSVIWQPGQETVTWGANHDGYRRLPDPVIHQRVVTYIKSQSRFLIRDSIHCQGAHTVRLRFHLHPDIGIAATAGNVFSLNGEKAIVKLHMDSQMDCEVFNGAVDPPMGWYAPRFNRLQKTNTLVGTARIKGTTILQSEVRIS